MWSDGQEEHETLNIRDENDATWFSFFESGGGRVYAKHLLLAPASRVGGPCFLLVSAIVRQQGAAKSGRTPFVFGCWKT